MNSLNDLRDSMVRRWATSCLLLLSGAFCAFALDVTQLQVTSKIISEVFMVTQNNKYSFTASVAIEVCEALHANIATKAQVETALQNGLEMCRFGWVEEKIAVAPRIQANPRCGQSKTGLVPWRAPESQLFDVFCFKDTGTVTTQRAMATRSVTTKKQEGSTSPRHPVTLPPLITSVLTRRVPLPTSTISPHAISPSIPPPPSKKADTTLHKTPVTTTSTTTRRTTTSTRSFPASSTTTSTSTTTSSSTSSTSTLSPPVQTAGLAPFHLEHSVQSNLGAAPVALLVTLGLLFVLLAATAVYYKKKGRSLPLQRPEQEKGAVETEMFKHFRERDLKRHPSTGDGERSRKCSSDITLLMEQEAKAEIA
ncbi:lymphatic vessel endothelial hyaluronic receptor 1b isoform X1 [Alosa sapidissima]|uniref:lymphatic vessel endothelial hyaluronic receptor 1b isoform X1 n=2 Tax=Alosa sapidissima TaxID=34773 RepID=UPI001C0858FE|nr:lymphatic vessel endothelial hyaluronic receptor 1b isoform X1 [Alosa sapidissima]